MEACVARGSRSHRSRKSQVKTCIRLRGDVQKCCTAVVAYTHFGTLVSCTKGFWLSLASIYNSGRKYK